MNTQLGVGDYVVVTGGYWAFTLTDGALRMLVLLHFHELGYSPVSIALLFLLYEFMGIVTNLVGGWLGARSGLNRTLMAGLMLQVVVLAALTFHSSNWSELVSVAYVMGLQALSGVAKDLTKMSAKSAVKFVAGEGALFRLVAVLTGSKNALKGVGFFLGAALLSWVGYDAALWSMAGLVGVALVAVWFGLGADLGKSGTPPPLGTVLSASPAINLLSAARLFLFASRDIWFVVALPVFLAEALDWSFDAIGAFMAAWVIGYGVVQSVAPRLVRPASDDLDGQAAAAGTWVVALTLVAVAMAGLVSLSVATTPTVLVGVMVFGAVFAVNSSLHSYLILAFSTGRDVSLDVGYYYSANAAGRLVGTLASGVAYLVGGLEAALWGSAGTLVVASLLTMWLGSAVGREGHAAVG